MDISTNDWTVVGLIFALKAGPLSYIDRLFSDVCKLLKVSFHTAGLDISPNDRSVPGGWRTPTVFVIIRMDVDEIIKAIHPVICSDGILCL